MTKYEVDPRAHSSLVVDGVKQAPSRAMLRAVGFHRRRFRTSRRSASRRPGAWSRRATCTSTRWPTRPRWAPTKPAARAVLFNTITVSDGISMGTPGMRYSLVSREVIADSIETVVGAEGFDGFVAIGGCDKNMPGCVMAMARLEPAGVFVYGGTIQPGRRNAATSSRVRSRRRARQRQRSSTRSCRRSSARRFPAPAPAAACTPRTRWPRRSKRSACRLPDSSAQEAVSRAQARRLPYAPAPRWCELIERGIRPSRHPVPRRRSRTRSPWSSRSAARPTRCCTCWRSRTRRACRSRSTTSRASASACRCWPTCAQRQVRDVRADRTSAASSR